MMKNVSIGLNKLYGHYITLEGSDNIKKYMSSIILSNIDEYRLNAFQTNDTWTPFTSSFASIIYLKYNQGLIDSYNKIYLSILRQSISNLLNEIIPIYNYDRIEIYSKKSFCYISLDDKIKNLYHVIRLDKGLDLVYDMFSLYLPFYYFINDYLIFFNDNIADYFTAIRLINDHTISVFLSDDIRYKNIDNDVFRIEDNEKFLVEFGYYADTKCTLECALDRVDKNNFNISLSMENMII